MVIVAAYMAGAAVTFVVFLAVFSPALIFGEYRRSRRVIVLMFVLWPVSAAMLAFLAIRHIKGEK